MEERYPAAAKIARVEIATARRHVFLCVGPDCCAPTDGLKVWEHLKARVRELGVPVLRTKAACLRVCIGGPWLVVYPEGTWYGAVTVERLDRVLREHVVGGRPIEEWSAARTGADAGD